MKRLLKWMLGLVLILAVLVFLGLLFKDPILRIIAERRIRSQTGMEARIGKLSSGFFSPVATIRDFKLFNTGEFGRTLFLDIPELHVEFDSAALARHELHVSVLQINLKEIDLVRNAAGQTNVFGILNKARMGGSGGGGASQMLKKYPFTGIDVLNLTLGKVRFVDLKDAANNREQNLNIDHQVFNHVKSGGDVSGIVLLLWLRSRGGLPLAPGPAGLPDSARTIFSP